MFDTDQESLTWQAHEHRPLEHGSDWFWALGIFSALSAVAAFILSNPLFGILILLAAGVMGILARREPPIHTFTLDKRGLSIDNDLYAIKDLRSFNIVAVETDVESEYSEEYLLLVDTPRFLTPDLVIPIVDVNPETVYLWFTEHEIPAADLRESVALKILELFGF